MLNQPKCNIIDISRRPELSEKPSDFDALIPQASIRDDEVEAIHETERRRSEKIGMDSMPEEIFNQVLETCFAEGGYKGFRDALYLVLQANWGVRFSDAIIVKRIDFINEHGAFRESCLFSELKTGKPRTMYINDTIKMCVLMVLWSKDFSPLEYLIVSDGRRKTYAIDENGNKIPQPLDYTTARKILVNKIIDEVGIKLKNVERCNGGKFKLATHSLRKLYSHKVQELFNEMYGEEGKAHTAAMEFLNWDLNHSSLQTTSRYCGDFEACKCAINMEMNVGYEVVERYYKAELEKRKCSQKVYK